MAIRQGLCNSRGSRSRYDLSLSVILQITVITSLPRRLAVKLLRQTQLSQVFENRVSPENLISTADKQAFHVGLGNLNQPIVRCCALMKSPPLLGVYIDGNGRNLLTAKRLGLTCVGIQGLTLCVHL